MSQTPGAIKQREWRWKMSPEKRTAFLAKRRERFAAMGIHEQRERRAKNPGLTAKYAKSWYDRNIERGRAIQKEYRARIKAETISAYGGFCVCCGESELTFLTVDHIVPKRKAMACGAPFYVKLKKHGFPKGYQILCFNCNQAKRTSSVCPHKTHYLKLVTAEAGVVPVQQKE